MTHTETLTPWYTDVEQDPIHAEAVEWLTRLQDPNLSFEDSLVWQRWMSADSRHAQAFARIEAVWEEPWELLRQARPKRERAPMVRWAIAASIGMVLVGAGALMLGGASLPWRINGIVVHTAVGENRSLSLRDGSRVVLGGGTQLRVAFDDETRRIELNRGEAFFTVAKDPRRPFSVRAGDATVTAIGTQFNVRRRSDRVVVAVVEGRVIVEPAPAPVPIAWLRKSSPQQAPAPLAAGEQTVVDADGAHSVARLADATAATAWQNGQLAFRQEPLRYVLEDVNRYSPKPIVIADESIGEIRITGTVLGSSVRGWVEGLESAFGLEAREEPERIVLEKGKADDPG